jgi:hypothetical protein
MEQMVNLDSEKYSALIRALSVLRENCNDIVINNGLVRQRSNDASTIFDFDLTALVNDSSFTISNIKEKIDLFKIFLEQEVRVEVDDTSFSFSDDFSSIKILKPGADWLDNKFMEEVEFNSLIQTNEETVLSSHSISPMISERMKVISASFHVNSFQIHFEGDVASIRSRTMSKDQHAKIIGNITLDEPTTGIANLVTIPYICDHDGDMTCRIYKVQDRCICKYSMSIGVVPVVIYTRCQIKTEG